MKIKKKKVFLHLQLAGDNISTSKFLKPKKIQVSLGFYTMSAIVLLKDGYK